MGHCIPYWLVGMVIFGVLGCTCFGSTYTKIGTIQRRLAWPLRKDDTQNREVFHIFRRPHHLFVDIQNICYQKCPCGKYFVSTFQFRYKMSSSAPIVENVSKRGAAAADSSWHWHSDRQRVSSWAGSCRTQHFAQVILLLELFVTDIDYLNS